MSRCCRIVYTSYIPGTDELLRGYCDDVVDLSPLYAQNGDRVDTYKRMAAAALAAALEAPPAAFALYGHPMLLSLPSSICLRAAPQLGIRVRTLVAVSAFDCLMSDLGLDPVGMGVQMHEATDVLLYDRRLDPSIATVLWQVGVLGTRLHAGAASSTPERLQMLVDHLLRFYPGTHPATLVASSVVPDQPAEIHRTSVELLPEASSLISVATTMYLPPAPDQAVVNPELASRLTSREYLASITRPRDGA